MPIDPNWWWWIKYRFKFFKFRIINFNIITLMKMAKNELKILVGKD